MTDTPSKKSIGKKMRDAIGSGAELALALSVFTEFYRAGKFDEIMGELQITIAERRTAPRNTNDEQVGD